MASKISKARTGRILNSLLRTISEEPTEFWKDITEGGDDRFITKAEAMVRTVYKMALGYKETLVNDEGKEYVINHPPDRYMLAMIWDRMEGRVGTAEELQERKAKIADRVSEQGKARIAAIGERDVTGTNSD